jgi:hypothetical protein
MEAIVVALLGKIILIVLAIPLMIGLLSRAASREREAYRGARPTEVPTTPGRRRTGTSSRSG